MNKYLENTFGLKGKTAIVTGAGGQLGGEFVRALLNAGAKVAAFDLNPESPKAKLSGIRSRNLLLVKADITDKVSLEAGLKTTIARLGSPSVMVNNAAIDAPPNGDQRNTGPFETYPQEAWDAMMNVNLKGMFFCCQIIGGHMAKHNKGSIINISSIYGLLSPDQRIYEYKKPRFFKPVAYSVTKSGVLNFTRYLAVYWAKKNVRVNTMTLAGVFNNQDSQFLKNYTPKVPLGRMAGQNEYNAALIYLASDASSYMTGSNMVIDGGFTAW